MPNKSAKKRKHDRLKKNEELNRNGRTRKQIKNKKKKRENTNGL